jgi:hypothetical protein
MIDRQGAACQLMSRDVILLGELLFQSMISIKPPEFGRHGQRFSESVLRQS